MATMEFVWVVPRSKLFPCATVHGFLPLAAARMQSEFLDVALEHGFFIERRYAETHPEYKQPIPYVAVTCEAFGSPERPSVFTMTRLAGGERRLHGKKSIGVGGHVNPCDAPAAAAGGSPAADPAGAADLFHRACMRELREELVLDESELQWDLEPLGLLNDDTTEVGAVHLGLVYQLRLPAERAGQLRIRESDGMSGAFEDYRGLLSLAEEEEPPFETWSTLLLRAGVLAARPVAVVG